MKHLPKSFKGTLNVEHWSGHGEGGTTLSVSMDMDLVKRLNSLYNVPSHILEQIGNGLTVTITIDEEV